MTPDAFAEYCTATLRHDPEQHTYELIVQCQVRDPRSGEMVLFSRECDLAPAIDLLMARFLELHAEAHGEGNIDVGGWTDYLKQAVDGAQAVAKNKAVQSIWKAASPFLKDELLGKIPGGPTGFRLATMAYDQLQAAKKNHPKAVATVKKVVELAATGDAKAQGVVSVMKRMNALLNAKASGAYSPSTPSLYGKRKPSLYELGNTAVGAVYDIGPEAATMTDGPYWAGHPHYQVSVGDREQVGSFLDKAFGKAKWVLPGYAAYRTVDYLANKKSAPSRVRSSIPGRNPSTFNYAPNRMAPSRPLPPSSEPTEEEYYDDETEDAEVSGYRTVSQFLVNADRKPGLGLSLRELYNRGMNRPKTSLTDVAREALSRAF